MAVAFQTAQGSFYYFDENRQTQRLKVSAGEGKGSVDPKATSVFVSSQDQQRLISLLSFKNGDKVEIGWVDLSKLSNGLSAMSEAEKLSAFIACPHDGRPLLVPDDCRAYLAIRKKDGTFKSLMMPELQPAQGLHPIDLSVDPQTGKRFFHTGNRITKVFDDQRTALAVLMQIVGTDTFIRIAHNVADNMGPERFNKAAQGILSKPGGCG